LIGLESKQQTVDELQAAVTDEERCQWQIEVDTSTLKEFNRDAGADYCETVTPKGPYWKRLPTGKEPVLVTLECPVPARRDAKYFLKLAYCIDQDGTVLGLKWNDNYGKLLEEREDKAEVEEKKEATKEESEPMDWTTPMTLDWIVLPGNTKSIRVFALYTQDPRTDAKELEIRLYEGPWQKL